MNYNLRDLRTNAGLTHQEVRDEIGLTEKEYQNAEYRGIQKRFRATVFPKLAELYTVSIQEIRLANMNTQKSSKVTPVKDDDESLSAIDLRTVFDKLENFDKPITMIHLLDFLERINAVDDLVVIDYRSTMESIVSEPPS